MEKIYQILEGFPGFKIGGSHYRIGSKLHSADFYYAKRIFQNSFFANRFAYIIASEIIHTVLPGLTAASRNKGLTLAGYGLYSELLLSLIEKFLKKAAGMNPEMINHILISDDAGLEIVKTDKVFSNCIIVVPIASTFSTALKIEEMLRKKYKEMEVLSPHINILHVDGTAGSTDITEMEKDFGWIKKDPANKIVEVKAFFEEGEVIKKQQYFLSLPTQWYKIETCTACYPSSNGIDGMTDEKPLFETDRSAVTPNIILDFPRAGSRGSGAPVIKFRLEPQMIRYGQRSKKNGHFVDAVNTSLFLSKNIRKVREWLNAQIRQDTKWRESFSDNDYVVIISSCHANNTSFINIINEELFHSAANIIHYDAEKDYIQNFELTYAHDLAQADKIIYIDDTLKSGNTFSRINEFVQYVLRLKKSGTGNTATGIDAIIVLINETNSYTNEILCNKLTGIAKIYSCISLNLYASVSGNAMPVIDEEKARYEALINDTVIDSLKVYYGKKFVSIEKPFTNADKEDKYKSYLHEKNIERHFTQLLAVHYIYQYFSQQDTMQFENMEFDGFLLDLHNKVNAPVDYALEFSESLNGFSPLGISVLTALTHLPFLQYEPLRKIVFKWVLLLLEKHIEKVNDAVQNNNFSYEDFKWLKYLLRRAALINSNYLISEKMFDCIKNIYSPNGLQALESILSNPANGNGKFVGLFANLPEVKRLQADDRIKELKDFHVFFIAQIKELLTRNESRALQLEQILKEHLKSGQPGYKQVTRVLSAENTIAIQRFYEFLRTSDKWEPLYFREGDDDEEPIINLLKQETIKRHLRYQTLQRFFEITKQMDASDETMPLPFLKYLWIEYFIEHDRYKKDLPLHKRTDYILSKIRQIFTQEGIYYPGVFLVVKDSEDKPLLVYDKNFEDKAVIEASDWQNEEDIYLRQFLEGIPVAGMPYSKTLIELKRDKQLNGWVDLYSVQNGSQKQEGLSYSFLPDNVNRLILMRLNKRTIAGTEKKLGIIGIYFMSTSAELTDANRMRYLLLLKNSLTGFIEHHHQNNEFRELLISENSKKLALLSGHGKDVLRDLAGNDKEGTIFSDIALNLEHLQLMILLDDKATTYGARISDKIKERFNLFYNVQGHSVIDNEYKDIAYKLAKDIYLFNEVEIKVNCGIEVNIDEDVYGFSFNKKLLNLILFEIFINAKKNRWHFFRGEEIKGYAENKLTVHFSMMVFEGVKSLKMDVTNTGPGIDTDLKKRLSHPTQNVKPNDLTSGTYLLKKLIGEILKGKIYFDTKSLSEPENFQLFTATVILKEMNGTTE
jgi:hypothetical protein